MDRHMGPDAHPSGCTLALVSRLLGQAVRHVDAAGSLCDDRADPPELFGRFAARERTEAVGDYSELHTQGYKAPIAYKWSWGECAERTPGPFFLLAESTRGELPFRNAAG